MYSDKFFIASNNFGVNTIEHLQTPRFIAKFATGDSVLPQFSNSARWTEQGADPGGDDDIHIFDQNWIDDLPEEEEFRELMVQTADFIDLEIACQM